MVSQTHGLVVRSEYHEKAEVAASNVDNKKVYFDDLVFNKLKAHLGVFFKSKVEFVGIVSPDYAVYYSFDKIKDLKFLELLFRLPMYIEQFIKLSTGIVEGLTRLYTSDLFDLFVPVPPKQDLFSILAFLKNEEMRIKSIVESQISQIEKLKEYKSILIDQAVTGKIKVS